MPFSVAMLICISLFLLNTASPQDEALSKWQLNDNLNVSVYLIKASKSCTSLSLVSSIVD